MDCPFELALSARIPLYGIETLMLESVAFARAQWASSDDSIDSLVQPVVAVQSCQLL